MSEKAKKVKVPEDTPLIRQFFEVKSQYPEAMLLYRVGDVYETYGSDAVEASKVLGLVLTGKSNGEKGRIEMAGFPHHAIDNYVPKLVRAGYKVAVCDQLEDPKFAKKLVKRGASDLFTRISTRIWRSWFSGPRTMRITSNGPRVTSSQPLRASRVSFDKDSINKVHLH